MHVLLGATTLGFRTSDVNDKLRVTFTLFESPVVDPVEVVLATRE